MNVTVPCKIRVLQYSHMIVHHVCWLVLDVILQTAKNLVLAGMNVTLQDNAVLEAEDMSALYFATMEEVGQLVSVASLAFALYRDISHLCSSFH